MRARFVPVSGPATTFLAGSGDDFEKEFDTLTETLYVQHCSSNSAFVLLPQGVDSGVDEEFLGGQVAFGPDGMSFTPSVERGPKKRRLGSVFR